MVYGWGYERLCVTAKLSAISFYFVNSKTLFLTIFDLRLSIIFTFSIAAYPVCGEMPYFVAYNLGQLNFWM